MTLVGRLVGYLIVATFGAALAAALMLLLVMPRMQWNARARPSVFEGWCARFVLRKWVQGNAPVAQNPIASTSENLRDREREYEEHCAVCHGLDGSAVNHVGGDFYPPIPASVRV